MNYSIGEIRNFCLENFILFTIFATGLLIYLHMYPYAFPGLASRISLVFFFYISSLIILYFFQIIFYFLKIIDTIMAACSMMPFGHKLELLVQRTIRFQIYTDYSQYTKDELTFIGINKAFQILFISFIVMLLIQELNPLMIERINMANFLILLIIFGIIALSANNEKRRRKIEPHTKLNYIFIGVAGFLGTVSVWYQIHAIGSISYIIAPLFGILIIILSASIIEKDGC